ncbi:MAG: hypothetical protein ACI9KE_002044 [Polyangiales bacterium]|jgi:hypothetical protein
MSTPITLPVKVGAATGLLHEHVKDRLRLTLDQPFAPGTPLKVEVAGMSIDAKSLGSRREGEHFALEVSLRTFTKHHRRKLTQLLAGEA